MAGSAVIGTLRALLMMDTADFESAAVRVSESAKGFSRDFKSIGQAATNLGTSLTKVLTVPLLGIGVGAAKAAIDFESAFAGVRKTVDATEPEFQAMAQSFRNLAKEIPVSVNELARLGEAAGALGIPKQEIVKFSEVMAKLGVTTNLTSDQAANAIARIQNIFGAAGKDTENLASTLVALGNAGASTETEIVEMAQRIAGAGHTIGLTQAQTLSFASTLASVGINAEAGGSAISRIFLKMNDAVMGGGKALDEFARVAGKSAEEFKTKFQTDAAGATVWFIDGLARLKAQGENTNATMEGMIGKNIILKDTLNRLTGSGNLLSKQLKVGNKAWSDNTALTIEAGKRFETTEAQLQLLWNRFKDVGITIGNTLLPAIKGLVAIAGALIPVIETLGKFFAGLPGPIQLVVVGIAGIAAAAGPVLYIFGQLALAAGQTAAAFTTNGIATKALTFVFGEATVAGGALTVALRGLGIAATVAAGAFIGWQIGRLIEQHDMLRTSIAALVPVLGEVERARDLANKQQTVVVDGIKAEAIARAEHAGIVLKGADAQSKYLEAVDALQKLETIRQAKFNTSIDLQKQAIQAELDLGRITQDQANARLSALAVDEKAQGIQKNRISLTQVAANAEAAFSKEIAATGYTQAQLTAAMVKDADTFKSWAKEVGLSDETISRLKASVKSHTTAQKESTKETKEAEKAAKELQQQLSALGVVTQRDVAEQFENFAENLSYATSNGVSMRAFLTAAIPKMEEFAKRAKAAGTDVHVMDEYLQALRATLRSLEGAPPVIDPAKIHTGVDALKLVLPGMKSITAAQLDAFKNQSLVNAAFEEFGLKTPAQLHKAAEEARQAYRDITNSGLASASDLIEASQRVLEAEIAAGERTVGIWQSLILPAIQGVIQSITGSVAENVVSLIGHWNRAGEAVKQIWSDIKTSISNVLTDILQDLEGRFIKGMLAVFTGAEGGFTDAFKGVLGNAGKAGGQAAIEQIGTEIQLGTPNVAATVAAPSGQLMGTTWATAFTSAANAIVWAKIGWDIATAVARWFGGGPGDKHESPDERTGHNPDPRGTNNPNPDNDPGNPDNPTEGDGGMQGEHTGGVDGGGSGYAVGTGGKYKAFSAFGTWTKLHNREGVVRPSDAGTIGVDIADAMANMGYAMPSLPRESYASGGSLQPIIIKTYLEGRQIAESTTKYQGEAASRYRMWR